MFAYSTDEENYHGRYVSREEALVDAADSADGQIGEVVTVWTGRIVDPSEFVEKMDLADRLIEDLEERLQDSIPYDDQIVTVAPDKVSEFSAELRLLVAKYCTYNAFGIDDASSHKVTIGEE